MAPRGPKRQVRPGRAGTARTPGRRSACTELAERIRSRRCVLVYEDRPVPRDLVAELLDAAVWAPNHHLTQPRRFVGVTGEGRRRIAEANRLPGLEQGAVYPDILVRPTLADFQAGHDPVLDAALTRV